jgi:KDO2-lipid IV(A) lauroyltransferase
MAAEVPIIVGYARRISDRLRYELGVERIIYPDEWRDREDPLRWITQEYTSAIERFVRRDPEQYLWIHRRWKSRPRGEGNTTAGAGSAAG